MSILLRPAHNLEHYYGDLNANHDHQINHLANEVAHNLRFADFGCHSGERLGYAATELAYDARHLTRKDFIREVAAIENHLPNRDLCIERSRCGDVLSINFDGQKIF